MAHYHYDIEKLVDRLADSGELDSFLDDVARYGMMCSENRRIEDILESPHVLAETKAALVETLIAPFFGWPFTALIERLRENGDIAAYPRLVESVRRTVRERTGACFADVASCQPLTGAQLERIRAHLQKLCGHRVYLMNMIDHDLLAGFVISIEGRMIDLSVRGDLSTLRTSLLEENR
ncbi:ATP synthase F1 subunit delta [Salinispira pacifica]